MKKSLIILLCGILTIGSLGCGNSSGQTSSSTPVETESASAETTESTQEEKQEMVKIGDFEVVKETNADKVIVDNNTCKITYKGIINSTEIKGTQFKLNVVNKTDKKIVIQVEDFSSNGKMHDVTCSINVLGGKEADDYISEPKIVTKTDKTNSVEAVLKILNEDFSIISKEPVKFDV